MEKIKIPGSDDLLTQAINRVAELRGQINELRAENKRLTDRVIQLNNELKSAYETEAGESV